MWSQTAVPAAADATHTHRPPSPPPSHASGQKRKAKGGRKKTREKGMVALEETAEEGSKERERGRKREIAAIFPFLITLS